MTAFARPIETATYCNPVYNQSFPDPFVLKYGSDFFAYCTGFWKDERVFGVLRSSDLVQWKEIGGAMERLNNEAPFYWAPEVTYSNGKFYLYYSVGNETLMEVRLAVSDSPEGGFVDSGVRLTSEEFAIDPHIFVDRDGTRYMFYATDFLEHTHIGTGTVVDRMIDWKTLVGDPRPVTRAKYDWQVYDPQRKEKGGVRWHTVEGPFVIERKGRYYEMFSGGNWQNTTYGVSFAVSDAVIHDAEWHQHSDGNKILPILRTDPGRIVGPGHNSVVVGPNNRELYCVYHRWTDEGRVLSIDRMDFAGGRLFVIGATDTPQPAPFRPQIDNPFAHGSLDRTAWETKGEWVFDTCEARCELSEKSSLILHQTPKSYLMNVDFSCIKTVNGGSVSFCLLNGDVSLCEISVQPKTRQASVLWSDGSHTREEVYSLPDFAPDARHSASMDVDGRKVRIRIDGIELPFSELMRGVSDCLALEATASSVTFSAFALTKGFEELFDEHTDFSANGWEVVGEKAEIESGGMTLSSGDSGDAAISRAETYDDFELAINIRLDQSLGPDTTYGVQIHSGDTIQLEFGIDPSLQEVFAKSPRETQTTAFPSTFTPEEYCQLRILRLGDSMTLFLDEKALWNIPFPAGQAGFRVFCRGGIVALDMIRLTVI
jgi:GH43 family beta-xylosidase